MRVFYDKDDIPGATPPADPPSDESKTMARQINAANKRTAELETELAKFKDDQAKVEEARLAEQGEFKTIAEQRAADLAAANEREAALTAELEAFKKQRQERLDAIAAKNSERIETLGDEWKDFPWDSDPERAAGQLDEIERRLGKQRPGPAGVFADGARPPSDGRPTGAKEQLEALRQRMADVQMGRVQTQDRGVQK
jgi:DNA repair exonuclease SbcCD ATPase subunit